jgi:hypothetical protein
MIHPLTGKKLKRDVRPMTVSYSGLEETVEQPGWYPSGNGDGVYDGLDLRVYSEAWERLAAKAHGRQAGSGLITPGIPGGSLGPSNRDAAAQQYDACAIVSVN